MTGCRSPAIPVTSRRSERVEARSTWWTARDDLLSGRELDDRRPSRLDHGPHIFPDSSRPPHPPRVPQDARRAPSLVGGGQGSVHTSLIDGRQRNDLHVRGGLYPLHEPAFFRGSAGERMLA
jgi:hypothetical protein